MFGSKTIYQHQIGLLFRHGKVVRTLAAGRHFLMPGSSVGTVDGRLQVVMVGGQEVLTSDGGSIRMSLLVTQQITNAELYFSTGGFLNGIGLNPMSSVTHIHYEAQISLREWARTRTLETALLESPQAGEFLLPILVAKGKECGITVSQVNLLDVQVAGGLKAAHADILRAELEGKAALARSRNEASTMRSLLNTARLVNEHPGLLELRVLSSGQKPRVSFVVNGRSGPSAEVEPES